MDSFPGPQQDPGLASLLVKGVLRGLALGALIYLVWVVGHLLVLTILE